MATSTKQSEYRSSTLAFAEFPDETSTDYDADTHTWKLGPAATTPRSIRDYSASKGHVMPEGLYLFFGNSSRYNVEQEMCYLDKLDPPSAGYDMRFSIVLPRKGVQRSSTRSLIWKSPDDINALYLGVGRTSKETNDLLRLYTGERYCIDRLAAEPWRINEYIQVLEMQHGRLKAVVFDAMTAHGRPAAVMRVLDPSIIEDFQPLGVYTSLHDPEPPHLELPEPDWKGWVPSAHLAEEDRDLVRQFMAIPEEDRVTRHSMIKQRADEFLKSGRIKPNPVMDDIIEERLVAE